MKLPRFKVASVLLSLILVFSLFSPSITLAQTDANNYENAGTEVEKEEVDHAQVSESNVQPMVWPLLARIAWSGGQKLVKVMSGSTAVATHKAAIHAGKQGKHILGHSNFQAGRSILTANADDLLSKYAGKGTMINQSKERVNFGKVIGDYFDPNTNQYVPTTNGIIHYSKTGAHIVPARP